LSKRKDWNIHFGLKNRVLSVFCGPKRQTLFVREYCFSAQQDTDYGQDFILDRWAFDPYIDCVNFVKNKARQVFFALCPVVPFAILVVPGKKCL
jgi:hypothetical protein